MSYLSTIGAFLYLAQCTRRDISFVVNLLTKFNFAHMQYHLTSIKTIFWYVKCTIDLSLFCPYRKTRGIAKASSNSKGFAAGWIIAICAPDTGHGPTGNLTPYAETPCDILVGFANVRYLSNPYKGCSQTSYVFTIGNTTISWRSSKQILVATSSNYAEIIALYEAVCECIWLRYTITHNLETSDLKWTTEEPICMYEDNDACIEQMK